VRDYLYKLLAHEMARVGRYATRVTQLHVLGHDDGSLAQHIDRECGVKLADSAEREGGEANLYIMNGNLNYSTDCEAVMSDIRHPAMGRHDRLAIVVYNSYLRPLYQLANSLSLRKGPYPTSFLSPTDLKNLARLTDFEITKTKHVGFFPWRALGIGDWLNRTLAEVPGIRALSLCSVTWLRPRSQEQTPSSLSIVVPARNEAGNIQRFFDELPPLNVTELELRFVEGNSSDETWQAIQDTLAAYQGPHTVMALQQPGKGKFDAVRHGFAHATKDLLTIVDADLTMPPELLGRFVDAYNAGHGDFINGNRLLYPMENEAMRPLNYLGNRFFARFVGYILGLPISDSLCGTKLLRRADYERQCAWRGDFGDFDPFGDFELLFNASNLELGVVDVPIRYRSRTYGSTQISRFKDGFELLRMCLIGFFRIKLR
jgi:hypothetical protein